MTSQFRRHKDYNKIIKLGGRLCLTVSSMENIAYEYKKIIGRISK